MGLFSSPSIKYDLQQVSSFCIVCALSWCWVVPKRTKSFAIFEELLLKQQKLLVGACLPKQLGSNTGDDIAACVSRCEWPLFPLHIPCGTIQYFV